MSYLNTFTSPRIKTSLLLVQSGGNYSIVAANPAAARTLNIIDPGGTDSFLFASATQTITNKTLGGNLAAGGFKITGLANGTASGDSCTYGQLQAAQAGIVPKASVRAATTGSLGSYSGGGTGTLTNTGTLATLVIDGVTMVAGNRLLNKNTGVDAGIYSVTTAGNGSTAWVITRTSDFSPGDEAEGVLTFVAEGTTNQATGWILTTEMPYTINTTSLTFTEFSAPTVYTAGNGISIASNVITAVGDGTSITATGGTIAIKSTWTGQTSITTLGTIATGIWNGTAIADANLAGSYIYANGTRALTANWAAGAFSATHNNVVIGQSANQINNADDATVNSTAVPSFTVRGGNKTGGSGTSGQGANVLVQGGSATGTSSTGYGGNVQLTGGSSVGGVGGSITLQPGTGIGSGSVFINDAITPTKQVYFTLSGATSNTSTQLVFSQTANRVLTFPDATDTVAGLAATQTFTNKTLTAPIVNWKVQAKSASYTLLGTDESINFTTGSSALNATLPSGATVGAGKRYTIRKVDSGTGTVTLVPNGSDVVALDSLVIDLQYDSITVESDGGSPANWFGV